MDIYQPFIESSSELLEDKSTTDRITIAVTGFNVSKLLGVKKSMTGTGEAQAKNVYDLLQKWKLTQHVVGMSFDTTSSNTGINKGACTLLEDDCITI
jgi:hypothetical protein